MNIYFEGSGPEWCLDYITCLRYTILVRNLRFHFFFLLVLSFVISEENVCSVWNGNFVRENKHWRLTYCPNRKHAVTFDKKKSCIGQNRSLCSPHTVIYLLRPLHNIRQCLFVFCGVRFQQCMCYGRNCGLYMSGRRRVWARCFWLELPVNVY